MIARANYKFKQEDQIKEEQYLCDTWKMYSALNFHQAPWDEVRAELGKIKWEKMQDLAKSCPSAALSEFHDRLLEILEKLVPMKRKRSKKKPKMHRMRRLLWKKHAKAKKKFQSSTSISKLSQNMLKMWKLESLLNSDYGATNDMEENEAVLRIKSN